MPLIHWAKIANAGCTPSILFAHVQWPTERGSYATCEHNSERIYLIRHSLTQGDMQRRPAIVVARRRSRALVCAPLQDLTGTYNFTKANPRGAADSRSLTMNACFTGPMSLKRSSSCSCMVHDDERDGHWTLADISAEFSASGQALEEGLTA